MREMNKLKDKKTEDDLKNKSDDDKVASEPTTSKSYYFQRQPEVEPEVNEHGETKIQARMREVMEKRRKKKMF